MASTLITTTTRTGITSRRTRVVYYQPRHQRPAQGALDRFDPAGIK